MKNFYFILICVILISGACLSGPLHIIEAHGGGRGISGGRGRGWGRGFTYYSGPSYGGYYNANPLYYEDTYYENPYYYY